MMVTSVLIEVCIFCNYYNCKVRYLYIQCMRIRKPYTDEIMHVKCWNDNSHNKTSTTITFRHKL